jgi:hypothetical protein
MPQEREELFPNLGEYELGPIKDMHGVFIGLGTQKKCFLNVYFEDSGK